MYFILCVYVCVCFSFLHLTENLIQQTFGQIGVLLFFAFWCFFLISKCSYVLHSFWHYFHAKAFKSPLTIFCDNFWLFQSKLVSIICDIIAKSVKYLLRFHPYFLIISLFSLHMCYVLSVLHVSHLYVCFVIICIYLQIDIPNRLLNYYN